MSDAPEVAPPTPDVEAAPPVVSPDEMVLPAIRDGRRPWLRAGAVFGGSLALSTAVFGAMVEHELWTGASAGFGLTLVLAVLYVLSIRAGYRSPALNLGQLFRRGLVTLAVGTVLWMVFVFMTLILCERSAAGAMLVLGFLGIITVFIVLALFSRGRSLERPEPAIRAVRALAWVTVLLVSVTALVPPLADAMVRRARGHEGSTTADVGDVGDD